MDFLYLKCLHKLALLCSISWRIKGKPEFIVNFITIANFCHISTRPKNLNMNHTRIPLIKKLFCLHQTSWNSKSAHVYCLNMKPIEKRIYLTSIWDQQVRARRKLSYIRNYFDMLSLDMISNNIPRCKANVWFAMMISK